MTQRLCTMCGPLNLFYTLNCNQDQFIKRFHLAPIIIYFFVIQRKLHRIITCASNYYDDSKDGGNGIPSSDKTISARTIICGHTCGCESLCVITYGNFCAIVWKCKISNSFVYSNTCRCASAEKYVRCAWGCKRKPSHTKGFVFLV